MATRNKTNKVKEIKEKPKQGVIRSHFWKDGAETYELKFKNKADKSGVRIEPRITPMQLEAIEIVKVPNSKDHIMLTLKKWNEKLT